MLLPDTNILVHAFRRDSEDHPPCRAATEGLLASSSSFALSPVVLSGFLRIVTHPKVFKEPSALAESLRFAEVLKNAPNALLLNPGPRHWEIFARLCRETRATGNLVPDAWLAALAIEHGCSFLSLDRDFSRFPGLNWETP